MLYELVLFTSIPTIVMMIIISTIILVNINQKTPASSVLFILSLVLFHLFSNIPILSWEYYVSYVIIGIAWWFLIFNVKLSKLKRFLSKEENKQFLEGGKIHEYSVLKDCIIKHMPEDIWFINISEPSYETFFNRVFCWPFSVASYVLGDLTLAIYNNLKSIIINYKKSFLGLNNE